MSLQRCGVRRKRHWTGAQFHCTFRTASVPSSQATPESHMPTNILMPALSPTMEEGKLAKWLVQEGSRIKPGDVIAEIETDKATMEVEAVDEGIVAQLLIEAGTEKVKVNTPIAVLRGEGEAATTAPAAKPAP